MVISEIAQKKIINLIDSIINRYISKASKEPTKNSGNPFVLALLEDFEPLLHTIHGVKTSLGGDMEKIAEIIAVDAWGIENVVRKTKQKMSIPRNVMQVIDSIVNELNNAKTNSSYREEIERIITACKSPSTSLVDFQYEIDLELYDKENDHRHFLEMKGPDPNTTEVPGAKRRLLTELAWGYLTKPCKVIDARFAIYYNNMIPKPYKNYKVLYYFDPNGGLLVHDNFWNFLGKDDNTYSELVEIFKIYGKENKEKIWTEFSKLVNRKQ